MAITELRFPIAEPTPVRIAVEEQTAPGQWRREHTQTRWLRTGDSGSAALHREARGVMAGMTTTWVAWEGDEEDPRTPAGRPIRALVLPENPADGDNAAAALHVWGGAGALDDQEPKPESAAAPVSARITDHEAEATSLLRAFINRIEDLPSAEQIAAAQVYATLFVGQSIERQTEEMELGREQREVDAAAVERPARAVYAWEHRGYTVAVGSLIPNLLWAVDIYWTADPDRGEGPSSFLSWGSASRAMRRARRWADHLADTEPEAAS